MYARILSGISRQQIHQQSSLEIRYRNDETLTSVIRTRHDAPENDEDRIFLLMKIDSQKDGGPDFVDLDTTVAGDSEDYPFALDL